MRYLLIVQAFVLPFAAVFIAVIYAGMLIDDAANFKWRTPIHVHDALFIGAVSAGVVCGFMAALGLREFVRRLV